MCAEPAPLKLRGHLCRDAGYGQAASVRCHSGVTVTVRRNLRQQRLFDSQILCNSLNDPIAIAQQRQIIFKIANRDARGIGGIIKGGRFGFFQALQRSRGNFAALRLVTRRCIGGNNVQQNHGQASIGQVGRNAHPHGARTQHGSLAQRLHQH